MKNCRKAAKISIEEFDKTIQQSNIRQMCFENKILSKDISKVRFDFENFSYQQNDYGIYKNLLGIQQVDDLVFLGCSAGGDWEHPVFFIIYWDGKHLRGYIPEKGNVYNRLTNYAFGNAGDDGEENRDIVCLRDEHGIIIPIDEANEDYHHDFDPSDASVLFNEQSILSDIKNRIRVKIVKIDKLKISKVKIKSDNLIYVLIGESKDCVGGSEDKNKVEEFKKILEKAGMFKTKYKIVEIPKII